MRDLRVLLLAISSFLEAALAAAADDRIGRSVRKGRGVQAAHPRWPRSLEADSLVEQAREAAHPWSLTPTSNEPRSLLRREMSLSREEAEARETSLNALQVDLEATQTREKYKQAPVASSSTAASSPIRHPNPEQAAQLLQQLDMSTQEVSSTLVETPPFLFIGILSSAGRQQQRDLVRRTWLQHNMLTRKGGRHATTAQFVITQPKGSEAAIALDREANEHKDIIRLAAKEDDAPAVKALEFLRWFNTSRKERYVVKMDDDTYPQLGRLMHLVHMANSNTLYMGRLAWCQKLQDGGNVPDVLPPYMAAGGYLLSSDLAGKISFADKDEVLKASPQIEGVSIGRLLREGRGINRSTVHYLALPSRSKHEITAAGCKETDVLSFGLSAEEIDCMWKQQAEAGGICCRSTKRENFGADVALLAAEALQPNLRNECPASDTWTM